MKGTKAHPLETNGYPQRDGGNFLYYGLLVYTFLFFSQIAIRFPVLRPFRIEFVLGSILLLSVVLKLLRGKITLRENELNAAVLFFLVVIAASVPFAVVRSVSLATFIGVFKFFAIYPMIIAAIDSERKLKGFIYVYFVMVSLIFVEPFYLSLFGEGFGFKSRIWRLRGVTPLFQHPNGLGMITATIIPMFYYFFRNGKSKSAKVVFLILIIIGLRVIMLTQSRTAFLGVLASIVFLWAVSRRKIVGLFAAILCLAVIWHFAPEETKNRFLTLSQAASVISEDPLSTATDIIEDPSSLGQEENLGGSMGSRLELMRRALVVFMENPVLGVGLGCFGRYSGMKWNSWAPPHNTYLQVLAETGVWGLFALSIVVFYTFKNLKRARRAVRKLRLEDSFLGTTANGLRASFAVFIVVSFFGIELANNFWWVAGGLSVVVVRILKAKYQAMELEQRLSD